MTRTVTAITQVVAVTASLLMATGCTKSPPIANDAPPVNGGGAIAEPNAASETWDIFLLQNKRVGYGRTTVRHGVEAGREIIRTENVNFLSVNRDGQTTKQEFRGTSLETPQGQLIRFESETRMGSHPMRTIGRVRGDRLEMETTGTGTDEPARTSIPWSSDCSGPFAAEQSLRRRPMRHGERRTLKMLMVGFNQVADMEMVAKDFEPTDLPGGGRNLLRIETVTRLADGQKIEGTVWTDGDGETLKSRSQAMGLETFRVTKAVALEKADTVELDLLASMMVEVERPLPEAHRTKQVCYQVHLDSGDPAGVFAAGPSQTIESLDSRTAKITVHAIRPGWSDGNAKAPADPLTDDDLRPNSFIQSEDPAIVADAKRAVGDETDPWRVALLLERFVGRQLKSKNFSQAFATASEVARSREGDCTEHAVYLAALARAQGIPARVAIGLVYMEGRQAFGYHMWTEVYVGKRWIPLDGTLALGGIGAGHLKIAHSNLKGASAYSAFLPVTQILGQLGIKIVKCEDR